MYLYAKESALDEAKAFASSFLSSIRPNCDLAQQESLFPSSSLLSAWKGMAEAAKALSSGAKALLKEDNPSDPTLKEATELYDFIALKYCEALNEAGGDFLYRFGSNPLLRGHPAKARGEEGALGWAILGGSALIGLGALLYFRRRKAKKEES